MAAYLEPKIELLKADEAINVGCAVRYGSDKNHVALAEAGERSIGIAMNTVSAAEDQIEVCLDGGCKVKLGAAVAGGQIVMPTTGGKLIKAAAEGDFCIAQVLEGGTTNDLVAAVICRLTAHAAEA